MRILSKVPDLIIVLWPTCSHKLPCSGHRCCAKELLIKIMGFVNQAGEDKKQIRAHGWVFAAGVLVFFWIIAGTLVALRSGVA